LSKYPFKETKIISFFLSEEYFVPEGVMKKPLIPLTFALTEILPDLNADKFVEFNF